MSVRDGAQAWSGTFLGMHTANHLSVCHMPKQGAWDEHTGSVNVPKSQMLLFLQRTRTGLSGDRPAFRVKSGSYRVVSWLLFLCFAEIMEQKEGNSFLSTLWCRKLADRKRDHLGIALYCTHTHI